MHRKLSKPTNKDNLIKKKQMTVLIRKLNNPFN